MSRGRRRRGKVGQGPVGPHEVGLVDFKVVVVFRVVDLVDGPPWPLDAVERAITVATSHPG